MNISNSKDLDKLTEQHWTRTQRQVETYIKTLLPCEIEHANEHQPRRAEQAPCDTLALLVGFSPDPLLQTIWVYRPKRIVLILNYNYAGKPADFMLRNFIDWIQELVNSSAFKETQQIARSLPAIPDPDEIRDIRIAPAEATAEWVFQALTELILPDQQSGKAIMVDITGAKKKMAAGAYLFAAYAGVQISYVDFEKYHPESRRPYGYSCEISPMPNPYDRLGLRDWQHVRNLYDQFAFGKAAAEVAQLRQRMARYNYLETPEQQAAMTKLEAVLAALEQWDNGDFYAALQDWQAQALPEKCMPQAMNVLGNHWPSARKGDLYQQHITLKQGEPSPQDSIFNRPELFLVYVHDELDKIGRLIRFNNDYRSAFLRAAGLDELLLKARMAILWLVGEVMPNNSSDNFQSLVNESGAKTFRRFLEDQSPISFRDRKYNQVAPINKNQAMKPYWENLQGVTLSASTMVDLRNEAIHTHLSIPLTIASDAYYIADASRQDFEDNWVKLLKKPIPIYRRWQLDWNDLCAACGVTFLPRLPKSTELSLVKENNS